MLLSESEIRSRLRDVDDLAVNYARLRDQILQLRVNPDLRTGSPEKVDELLRKLIEIRQTAQSDQRVAESLASGKVAHRDKENPQVLGLRSNLIHKSRELVRLLDRIDRDIEDTIRQAGQPGSRTNNIVLYAGRRLEALYDHGSGKFQGSAIEQLILGLFIAIAALRKTR